MKQLKLTAVNHPQFDKVLVKVSEQTNFGDKFGNNPEDLRIFIAHNGIKIGSNSHPSLDSQDPNTFWVKGLGPENKQGNCFVVSKAKYEKLKAAVAFYNFYYSSPEINKRVRAKRAAAEAAEAEARRLAADAFVQQSRLVG